MVFACSSLNVQSIMDQMKAPVSSKTFQVLLDVENVSPKTLLLIFKVLYGNSV
eukprot:CAMPEP_0113310738 /NCGR_PEP_ID=MMETSP0010_2-20120614/8264_1 /TAXON_ID=216773 ORGANISM="Corethron hystrix, Strain 308" /NCGR_SAMPLE_ID=MMETSP0010_2 /ASSEMBLY_ACC=CAM_ASM_000155 /LENGTH=52 /DNA_ID=CAMNT_0000166255 /DNA_START=1163 /DNA_END=1321 /DNA_ORIENTATION=+ /assembly_acc=CAM_ASM_000155